MQTFFQSKISRIVLWGIGGMIVLLITFKAGEFVGFHRASFSYRWGERYYRGVAGPERGFLGGEDQDFLISHGLVGSIIKVSSSSIILQNRNGVENTIAIGTSTVIKKFRDTISAGELKENDQVIVIGSPDTNGEIEAKLIRIVPPPPNKPNQ